METLVFVLMVLVCFNFLLKQTDCPYGITFAVAVACALFTGLIWPYAITQSKTQIASWLENPSLMLDTAVVLSIDVIVQMVYCILYVYVHIDRSRNKKKIWIYKILKLYPGLLIFPVLFSTLVSLIFSMPGKSFPLIAWSLAAIVLVIIPAGRMLLKKLLPEEELRIELLFLLNAAAAIIGTIATVNGRTAVEGNTSVNIGALSGILILVLTGISAGYLLRRYRISKRTKKKIV
ncbi:hypothetical protein [Phocaeicola abscessus]|uniref:hypothetical protein n=1 Tax=Phocaeicola abscessus TaxID=555313 RepID=UPI0003856841|nr:hypothetical protein [Phocaeicola abscessus]EPT33061.1 putative membrane protein [Bacteroidetes bacterium oral taxon 272 str. F0290]